MLDEVAEMSHLRAHKATQQGLFSKERAPISYKEKREVKELAADEPITGGFSHENLDNALQMVFGTSNYLPNLGKDGQVYLSPIK